jgi:hypothetical protein
MAAGRDPLDGKGTLTGMIALDEILALLAKELSLIGGLVEMGAPHALPRHP